MNDKIKLLELANKQISSNEEFLAYVLNQYSEIEHLTVEAIMEMLECNIEGYYKLGLCKAPITTHANYITELSKVTDYIGISAIPLNKIIRRVDTIVRLRNSSTESYLMAARDKNKKSNDQDDPK